MSQVAAYELLPQLLLDVVMLKVHAHDEFLELWIGAYVHELNYNFIINNVSGKIVSFPNYRIPR